MMQIGEIFFHSYASSDRSVINVSSLLISPERKSPISVNLMSLKNFSIKKSSFSFKYFPRLLPKFGRLTVQLQLILALNVATSWISSAPVPCVFPYFGVFCKIIHYFLFWRLFLHETEKKTEGMSFIMNLHNTPLVFVIFKDLLYIKIFQTVDYHYLLIVNPMNCPCVVL